MGAYPTNWGEEEDDSSKNSHFKQKGAGTK